ncbi:YcbK family protein [Thermohalobaculum sediminis]|uniref:YcbK family protein n=1 Tax=Thermohalobaculum sediminis TaxID=2939436 RepID=UPI0022286260|nr:DUF882 domain-containing protein [Limibaculum sediminis]
MDRRSFLIGAAALSGLCATPIPAAPAVLRGKGDFRSLALVNRRTGEWIKSVYWLEGEYIPEALDAMNHILRDWRQDQATPMDPTVLDILAATHGLLDTSEPFEIISGYRTPDTNQMLRNRSKGVASNSYHMKGMAVDVTLKSRSVRQISGAGQSLKAGGVGKYSRSQFVHLDSGPVRDWGR